MMSWRIAQLMRLHSDEPFTVGSVSFNPEHSTTAPARALSNQHHFSSASDIRLLNTTQKRRSGSRPDSMRTDVNSSPAQRGKEPELEKKRKKNNEGRAIHRFDSP